MSDVFWGDRVDGVPGDGVWEQYCEVGGDGVASDKGG